MKANIFILTSFIFVFFLNANVYSQNSSTEGKNYDVEKIMKQQSFDIDDQEYRKAETIAEVLIEEFTSLHSLKNPEKDAQVEDILKKIKSALKSAKAINMNISMFSEDVDYYKEITKKIPLNYETK